MRITASTEDEITVLQLEGKLIIGAADEAFSAAIDRQPEAGRIVLVLDLENQTALPLGLGPGFDLGYGSDEG